MNTKLSEELIFKLNKEEDLLLPTKKIFQTEMERFFLESVKKFNSSSMAATIGSIHLDPDHPRKPDEADERVMHYCEEVNKKMDVVLKVKGYISTETFFNMYNILILLLEVTEEVEVLKIQEKK